MNSFKKMFVPFASILLLLVVASPLIDAEDSSPLITSPVSFGRDLLEAQIDNELFRELQDISNATDLEGDSHGDDHEEDAEMAAKCTCVEGNIFCMTVDALKHCHCDSEGVHCEKDHDDHDDHDSHDDHDDHDSHDDHDDHDDHDNHDDHDSHDDHDDHDSHDDHGHSQLQYDGDKPWGTVILMTLIINLTTLAGTVVVGGHWTRNLLCPTWNASTRVGTLWANVIIPMFACGTLMATTFFLLLPEALHLIESAFGGGHHDDHRRMLSGDDESKTTWRWGASILGGFFLPVILHALFPTTSHNHAYSSCQNNNSGKDEILESTKPSSNENSLKSEAEEQPVVDVEKDGSKNTNIDQVAITLDTTYQTKLTDASGEITKPDNDDEYVTICGCFRLKNLSLFISMNIGEMLHNFTDGIFVGAAYVGCGSAMGDSVVLATVIHEIPNQLAGYLVMVNQNGINPILALAINFLFGLSVLLGGLVVLVLDLGNLAIGSIFAVGGGIFLHVAIFEMLGTADRGIAKQIDWVWVTLAFLVGAVLIGLVLINHEHCGGH